MAFSGKLTFNPMTDTIDEFKFNPPSGVSLPQDGFAKGIYFIILGRETYKAPTTQPPVPSVNVVIKEGSDRLQRLAPFEKYNGGELKDLICLVKVRGKCTTDHISAAGKWLKYKGHLENISNNTLIGAMNDVNGKVNYIENQLNGEFDTIPNVARNYLKNNESWVVIADDNYGEGSAREHAALQPRYLGCKMIIAKSFAR